MDNLVLEEEERAVSVSSETRLRRRNRRRTKSRKRTGSGFRNSTFLQFELNDDLVARETALFYFISTTSSADNDDDVDNVVAEVGRRRCEGDGGSVEGASRRKREPSDL